MLVLHFEKTSLLFALDSKLRIAGEYGDWVTWVQDGVRLGGRTMETQTWIFRSIEKLSLGDEHLKSI